MLTPPAPPGDLVELERWSPAAADRNPAVTYLSRLAPSGRRSQRSALERVARLLTGGRLGWHELPWHRLRYQHAAAVRSYLASTCTSPATANTYRSALRGVMRECWRLGLISAEEHERIRSVEPVRGSRLPRGRALSRGELVALFSSLAEDDSVAARRDAAMLAVLYASGGVRRSELVSLDLADLNREEGSLRIIGKGNKERTVWLSREALAAIEDWLVVRGPEPGPLFLPVNKDRATVRHGERLSVATVWLACRRRAEQARIDPISPHDLRRSSISDLLDQTADLALVSKLAGHSSPTTTSRYDRRPEEAKRRAARGLHLPYRRRPARPGAQAGSLPS